MNNIYAILKRLHTRWADANKIVILLTLLFCISPARAVEAEFLDPEVAFAMRVLPIDNANVEVTFAIAEGYYLYQDKLKFSATAGAVPGTVQLPVAQIKDDPFQHKKKAVYRNTLIFRLPVSQQGQPFTLTVTAQGCADAGLCYPPFRQSFELVMPVAATPAVVATAPVDDSSRIQAMLSESNIALTLASFFGFGLLLALTPCVFPMIPILSGIIVGQGASISKKRAFSLSLTYVLGMAITYSLAGVAAGLSGTLLSNALQNIWVLSGFALIFVVLSLSMFDVYQLQLPAGLQGRLSDTANKQGGSVTGVALMGALSALIVGPCVAAPLAGALLYIAQTGDALLGGVALFCLALGMGTPLLAIGVAARSLLPKAGAWMENVKKVFGVLLLAMAIWIVSPVASPLFTMLAIAALALFTGVILHALDPLPAHAGTGKRLGKSVGVIAVTVGLAMLIGVLAGSRDPLQPLAFLQAQAATTEERKETDFARITSTQDLETSLQKTTQPVLLDFYADWCVSCKEMEQFTFSDAVVRTHLEKLTLVQADVTDNSAENKALLKRFGLFGPPAVILIDQQGKEISRVIGFQNPERFAQLLDSALRPAENPI